MPLFKYKGRNTAGESIKGEREADSSSEVANHLINIGITPIDIHAVQIKQTNLLEQFLQTLTQRPPSDNDLIMFSRQMSTLLKAGIPILSALHGLKPQMEHKGMSEAIDEIAHDIESGRTLSTSMMKYPHIFSTLFSSMVNVGENTGQIEQAFQQIYKYLEVDKNTKDRIKAAIRYPTFVIVAMVTAVVIINLFVIPSFAKVFAGFNAELPWATQLLLSTSRFSTDYWQLLLLMFVIAFMGIKGYLKTDKGRYQWDRYKLRLPVVGSIFERATLARFARSFSMTFSAGVPITQTLVIVSLAVENSYIEQRILSMRDGLERGESLTRTAITSNLFTPLVLQMMSVGEDTGSVDQMLDEVAGFYEREVEYDTNKLSSAIEPILITVIGGMVLVLALGVFLPMWDLGSVAMSN